MFPENAPRPIPTTSRTAPERIFKNRHGADFTHRVIASCSRRTDALDYLPTTISQLNSASAGETAPAHVRRWRTDYDYLYIVGDQTANIPDHLTIMMRGRRFTLYAIGK